MHSRPQKPLVANNSLGQEWSEHHAPKAACWIVSRGLMFQVLWLFCSLRATIYLLYSFHPSSCCPQSSLCFMTCPAVTCSQTSKPVASMGAVTAALGGCCHSATHKPFGPGNIPGGSPHTYRRPDKMLLWNNMKTRCGADNGSILWTTLI